MRDEATVTVEIEGTEEQLRDLNLAITGEIVDLQTSKIDWSDELEYLYGIQRTVGKAISELQNESEALK